MRYGGVDGNWVVLKSSFSRNRQCLRDQREVVGETLHDIKGLEGLLPCCTSSLYIHVW